MPETIDRVKELLTWLQNNEIPPVALLIVPRTTWSEPDLQWLRQLADLGHELVAHGWSHQTIPRKIQHRIHALLISRNVAEHLDLNPSEVFELMHLSANWFIQNRLPAPVTYVPPAWALGPLKPSDWPRLPYRIIENTRGFIHTGKEEQISLPLTGFEADNWIRKTFLQLWNQRQASISAKSGKPLRISIHPNDRQLRLAEQMDELISLPSQFLSYRDL